MDTMKLTNVPIEAVKMVEVISCPKVAIKLETSPPKNPTFV